MPCKRKYFTTLLCATLSVALLLVGCMKYGPLDQETFSFPTPPGEEPEGVFIVCEGNFMYGNATLSFYLPSDGTLENEVFARANGMKLGDVAQSMTIGANGLGYVVVNNSGVVYGIDTETFKVRTLIEGVASPRYVHFVDEDKAYVTSLYEPRIAVFDPRTSHFTGSVETPGHTSTERMALFDGHLLVTCWSHDDTILVVDIATDTVVEEIRVRKQPRSMVLDRNGKLWVLTDGGYLASDYGYEAPALYRIDAATCTIEREFLFALGDSPKDLCIDGAGKAVYFINESVWRMDVDSDTLPADAFLPAAGTIYYSLGVDPRTGEVYVGDAIDYRQRGVVYRFAPTGECRDTLRVGITPAGFCFR